MESVHKDSKFLLCVDKKMKAAATSVHKDSKFLLCVDEAFTVRLSRSIRIQNFYCV